MSVQTLTIDIQKLADDIVVKIDPQAFLLTYIMKHGDDNLWTLRVIKHLWLS